MSCSWRRSPTSFAVKERRTVPVTGLTLRFWRKHLKKRNAQAGQNRKKQLAALKAESERNLRDQIRRLLAQPADRRTHFLRRRIGLSGSAL